jgi:hypothetical protein
MANVGLEEGRVEQDTSGGEHSSACRSFSSLRKPKWRLGHQFAGRVMDPRSKGHRDMRRR